MIDLSKAKSGDVVTVRAKIAEADDSQGYPIRLHGGSWIKREDVLSITPATRGFKPGDRVTWGDGLDVYEFIAQRGAVAIVWDADYGIQGPSLSDLRHADERE